jgi:hypothetical protein
MCVCLCSVCDPVCDRVCDPVLGFLISPYFLLNLLLLCTMFVISFVGIGVVIIIAITSIITRIIP